jgi:NadR type nicotinamide-nucleotide adenylyltransferase
VRNIVLHGPESTGKSTLAAQLATHFDTVWVPEYGRDYCERKSDALRPSDLVAIMRGHIAAVREMSTLANGFLIQDTDPLMTAAWSVMLFGHRMAELDAFEAVGDLYLLMDIDLPWIADSVRMFPGRAEQERFLALSIAELDRRGISHVRISGDGRSRFDAAVAAIVGAGLVPAPR